jgi:ligand-binding sensor domain-containing protein/signal transduction histidine kinase
VKRDKLAGMLRAENRRELKAWCCLILFSLVYSATHASTVPDDYTRQLWHVQDGLPEDTVQALVQDAHGLLWVATTGGVASFDGSEFSVLGANGSPTLPVNSVFCLLAGKDGSIWMGSEGGGLFRLRDGKLRHYGMAQGLADPFVRALLEDDRGQLWIGTDRGLFVLPPGAKQMQRKDANSALASMAVHALAEDREHTVWVGGPKLLAFANGGSLAQVFTLPGIDSESRIKAVLPAADGTIWIGTVDGLDWMRDNRFHQVKEIAGTVRMLRQTTDGAIWAGTIGHGLWMLQGKRFERVDRGELLPSKSVLAMFEDRDRQLWIGTQAGLVRLSKTPVHLLPLPQASDPDFETVSRDRDDSIWVAGSSVFRVRDRQVTAESFPMLGDPAVRNLYRATDGSLWIGTDGRGAFRISGGVVTHFRAPNTLPNDFVRAFLEGRHGDIWIGTDSGLAHVMKSGVRQYRMQDGLAYFSTRSLLEALDGDVWIGTEQGLSDWRGGHFVANAVTHALAGEKVWSMAQTPDGFLWIGTRDHGLFRARGDTVVQLTQTQGLPMNSIYGIAEREGRLWFSGPNLLFSASLAALEASDGSADKAIRVQTYGLPFNAENAQFYGGRQPSVALDAEGRLWFPSSKGLIYINTQQRLPARTEAAVAIAGILIDGQQQAKDEAKVVMSADAHRLVVNYAPLLLRPQGSARFRYKLEGFDKAWTYAGPGRTASYTNLAAGRYNFHVQVLDGPVPSGEAYLAIEKQPQFWQTWWFASGALLVLIGTAWGGLLLRVRRIHGRFEAVLVERARLAREMHDTLIQGCTSVSALLEAVASRRRATSGTEVELLDLARQQVRTTIDEARDAVWDLRHKDEAERKLQDVMEALAVQARHDFKIAIVCRTEGEPLVLAGRAVHEISMMVREAVGNAATHGRPGTIAMAARVDRERVSIRVADDGAGFVPAEKSGHFGIAGMRERTEQFGGKLLLESTPGKGAQVEFLLSRGALQRKRWGMLR